VNSVHAARFLRLAFSLVFGIVAFGAVADSPVPQAPLELTAANLASVVDPLMAEWIGKRKGPRAVVVVVKRDGPVFAKGYGFLGHRDWEAIHRRCNSGAARIDLEAFHGIAVMQLVDAAASILIAT